MNSSAIGRAKTKITMPAIDISTIASRFASQPLRSALCGWPRAELLADDRAGGGAEAEAGQERQRQDAHADEVRGDRAGAVARGDAEVEQEADLHEQLLERRSDCRRR